MNQKKHSPTAAEREQFPHWEQVFLDQLHRQILGFWLAHGTDRKHGGFVPWLDRAGNPDPKRNDPKSLVQQSRMVWSFSAAHNLDARRNYSAEAKRGLEFFEAAFWDKQNGGWFWSVNGDGTPRERQKHLYGQSFAIYALAEYGRAFNDRKAVARALETFRLIDAKAHDPRGGYREKFTADWQPDEKSTMISPPNTKSMNTHIHLLESYTALLRVSKDPVVRERLEELLRLCIERITTQEGYSILFFDHDWKPRDGICSYGHDVELAWLMLEATEVLGRPNDPRVVEHARALVDHTLQYGYDAERGGIFYEGPYHGAATDRRKDWWPQAEALVGFLAIYQQTRDQKYWLAFEQTADWCVKYQADTDPSLRSGGEWFATVEPDGKPRDGAKVHPWKAAYHHGRACIEVASRLKEMQTTGVKTLNR